VSIRKINKAVYLILEKYHSFYGLKLAGFSGGHGYGYGMFYLDAVKPVVNGLVDTNYESLNRSRSQSLSLVFYLDNVGIPSWGNHNQQLGLKNWSRKRTFEIQKWLLKNLTLNDCFDTYSDDIKRWRSSYTVEDSEKYLLVMNIVGLYCERKKLCFSTLASSFSEYDSDAHRKKEHIANKLNIRDTFGSLWGDENLCFSTNGYALLNSTRLVDIWELYLSKKSPEQILDELMSP